MKGRSVIVGWWLLNELRIVRFWKNCTWLFKTHKQVFSLQLFWSHHIYDCLHLLFYDSSQDSIWKVPLRDLFNTWHFMPEIESQKGGRLGQDYTATVQQFKVSHPPQVVWPLYLCSFNYKVLLLLHIFLFPYKINYYLSKPHKWEFSYK